MNKKEQDIHIQRITNTPGIRWTSKTEYYDIENGEQLTQREAHKNYIKLKTNKHVKFNQQKTLGTISYTIECRRQPQLKLKL